MIEDIIKYSNKLPIYKKVNWKKLWEEKLDYYEYQISELGLKYKKLRESFSYYSGLCENAICLLNYANFDVSMYSTYKRGRVIDNITRDVAEYIKYEFFYNDNIVSIQKLNLTNTEYILLMSRLLYPSYYFDMYDGIIQGKIDEGEIDKIIKKNSAFELFLKSVYRYIRQRSSIPLIDWFYSDYF